MDHLLYGMYGMYALEDVIERSKYSDQNYVISMIDVLVISI